MPHVGDSRRALTTSGGRIEGEVGLFVVPEVNPIVMAGMEGFSGNHLFEQGVHREVTDEGAPVAAIDPELQPQEGLGLKIFRKFVEDLLEGSGVVFMPLSIFAAIRLEKCIQGFQVHPLALRNSFLSLQ
jgi:hypothetical protein